MKTTEIILFIFLLFPVMLVSCNHDKPDNLIEEEIYLDMFAELIIVNQLRDAQLNEVSRDSLIELVYDKYNYSAETFRESHNYYQRDAEKQIERLEKVTKRLESERYLIELYLDSLRQETLNTDENFEIEMEIQDPDNL